MRERVSREDERATEPREPSAAAPTTEPTAVLGLQRMAGNQAVGRMLASRRSLARMSVRTAATPAIVSGETRAKHVVAEADQETEAQAGYGSRTFVTSDKALTDVIDADPYDFSEATGKASSRKDIQANVVISLFDKVGTPPASFAKGNAVTKTIDNKSTLCEIGAIKGGDDKIKVTHFKKL